MMQRKASWKLLCAYIVIKDCTVLCISLFIYVQLLDVIYFTSVNSLLILQSFDRFINAFWPRIEHRVSFCRTMLVDVEHIVCL